MPSAIAHAAPALALIPAFANRATPARLWIAGALCAAAPDLDVIGFAFGIPYGHWLGHRGVTHGIPFAAALAAAVAWVWFRPLRVRAWLYLFFATASHGALDALTNGGLGVALLSPFDTTRYFAPFRPIEVYNLTKLYNILFTAELARRVQDRSVAVNCLSPGFLRTDLGREATGFFRLFLALSRPFRKPPELGAAAVMKIAEAEVTGRYFRGTAPATPSLLARDPQAAARLWDLSWDLVSTASQRPEGLP